MAKLMKDWEIDCSLEPEIKCPYCGYKDTDSWEYNMGQDDEIEVECGNCEEEFLVTCHIEVTYSSYPKED